ncbi:MAG: hypothetical protein EXS17_06360 [Phycisphaerales bacterium]|nr:hypothetical protein [Phycisphaerales bacterium]
MSVVAAIAWLIVPRLFITNDAPRSCGRPSISCSRDTVLLLCVVLLLGLTERVWRVSESFWFDEISALVDYAQYGPGAIVATYFVQSNHVLHTLLSWCAITLAAGASEPILRLPALLCGLAAIPIIALLAGECAIWRGVSHSVAVSIACALAALSPIMVVESVEARGYSMMILFAALACWQFLRGWRTGESGAWIIYAIACVLGVWTHFTFVALPISHGVIAAWFLIRRGSSAIDRRAARTAIAALVLGAITTLALLAPLLPDLLSIRSEFQALDGNEPSLISREGFHLLIGLGGSWTPLFALPGLALFLLGVWGSIHDTARRFPLAVTLLALPLMIVGTTLAGSWMYARFGLFALPGILLAIALGLCDLRTKRLMTVIGVILAFVWTADLYTLPAKQPIRDAVFFVRDQDRSVTSLASAGLADNVVAYYGVVAKIDVANAGSAGSNLATLSPTIVWLIVLYPESLTEEARGLIERDWTLVQRFEGWVDWTNGDVLVYCRKQSATR